MSAQGPINPPTPGVAPEGRQGRSPDTIGDDVFVGPTQVYHSGHEDTHGSCKEGEACPEHFNITPHYHIIEAMVVLHR